MNKTVLVDDDEVVWESPYVKGWCERVPQVYMCEGESMTQQSFAPESDINRILERFQETGSMPATRNQNAAVYADVTGLQKDLTQAIIDSDDVLEVTDNAHRTVAARVKAAAEAASRSRQAPPAPSPSAPPASGSGDAEPTTP